LLLPLIGLIPVVAAVVASEWPFGSGAGSPNAPRAAAPGTTVVTTVSATSTPAPALTTQAIPAPAVATSAPTAAIGSSAPGAAAAPTPGTAAAGSAATASASGSTAIQASTSPATGPFTAYRVQPGDTVKFVAEMYGVSPASVSNASGLQNPDRLQVGQLLTIPNQSGWLYRVQPGETLDQIAARTGVSSDTIATVSHLTVASVRAGDVILIPDLTALKSK